MNVPLKVDLKDKVAVVTGGGGILCAVMAKAIAACGAKVAILDLREEAAQKVADEITAEGGVAIGVACNVLSTEACEAAKAIVNEKLGSVDILINGAGGNHPRGNTTNEYYSKADVMNPDVISFYDLSPENIQFVFNLNFVGTLIPTQVFSKDMVDKDDASIINISSMSAYSPLTKVSAYSAAKAAISNFTQWLATHFSTTNIRVNAIAPGFFVTAQNRDLLKNPDGSWTARSEKILAGTPMKRMGEAEELLGGLLFLLCKEASGFINGIILPIDGGFNAYCGV
ncbi:MAG: SDR family oxidoreductase [Clostridia bacterium]|nr:SDR family NAD(P)-dependent oxidoreductase [Oscillospiraceae bacterium]MBR4892510.1 SDR family oxidoreductase [Clostridia bacterium]